MVDDAPHTRSSLRQSSNLTRSSAGSGTNPSSGSGTSSSSSAQRDTTRATTATMNNSSRGTGSSPRSSAHKTRASLGYVSSSSSELGGSSSSRLNASTSSSAGLNSATTTRRLSTFGTTTSSPYSSMSSTRTPNSSRTRTTGSEGSGGGSAIASAAAAIRAEAEASASTPSTTTTTTTTPRTTGSPKTPARTVTRSSSSTTPMNRSPKSMTMAQQQLFEFPSLATTSPPINLAKLSPRVSSRGNSPRTSPASSSITSARTRINTDSVARRIRPVPPPLSIDSSPSSKQTPKGTRILTSSQVESSEDSADEDDLENGQILSVDAYANWSMPPGSSSASLTTTMTPARQRRDVNTGSSTSTSAMASKGEGNDTLSNLNAFASSSQTSHDSSAWTSNFGQLSLNDEGTEESSVSRTGFGLGLPFSHSTSTSSSLSSLSKNNHNNNPDDSTTSGHSTSFQSNESHPSTTPSGLSRRSTDRSSRSTSAASGPESPVTDRRQLIGLGELATPRWTSGVLERRWGSMDTASGTEGGISEEDTRYWKDENGVEPMVSSKRRSIHSVAVNLLGLTLSSSQPAFARQLSIESPTLTRQPGRSPSASETANGNSGAFSYASQPMHPTTLFPSTASSSTTPSGTNAFEADRRSPLPSHASASNSPAMPSGSRSSSSGLRKRPSTSSAAASPSIPSAAKNHSISSDSSWLMSDPVVGLGFEYEASGTRGDFLQDGEFPQSVQSAHSSGGGGSASRQSSTGTSGVSRVSDIGRSTSASTTPRSATTAIKRQSSSRNSYAHLPPSPAASTAAAHVLAASQNAPPLPSSSSGLPSSGSTLSSSIHTTPGRTPEHPRHSHHSSGYHASSPSVVAASILRQTRELDLVGGDMDEAAAVDEGTAEALRKLDGLSSPRISRVLSNKDGVSTTTTGGLSRSGSGSSRSRANSFGRRNSEELKTRRKSRNSSGEALAREAELEPLPKSISMSNTEMTDATIDSPSLSTPFSNLATSSSTPQSPAISQSASISGVSTNPIRASSHASAHYDVPFPTSSPIHRGSSSSASATTATFASSHDSTSGASISNYSLATTAPRSGSSKNQNRRSSMGSDVSSIHSTDTGGERRVLDQRDSGDGETACIVIPPVPPLPKDWEVYNNRSSGANASAQNSPQIEFDERLHSARASDAGSANLLSPSMAENIEWPTTNQSASSSLYAPSPKIPQPRKWSLSSAFSKASSKGLKSPSIKESSSFNDLSNAGDSRQRKLSTSSRISDSGVLPRRLTVSTNDIAGLANSLSSPQASPALSSSSFGRSTSRHLSSIVSGNSSRERTMSQSSNMTDRTALGIHNNATPSVVATSPGRSRSSLLSPRRTPSGIPFFSRGKEEKEHSSAMTTTPSPIPDTNQNTPRTREATTSPPPSDRSAGRKSILGLNFLRKDKDKNSKKSSSSGSSSKASSTELKRRSSLAASSIASASSAFEDSKSVDEFGKRSGVMTSKSQSKTVPTNMRKRGMTLGPAEHSKTSSAPVLPPLHVPALSATTVRRVDSLSSTHSTTSSKQPSTVNRVPAPSARVNKLQESVKANLPTIAGSPSSHGNTALPDTSSHDDQSGNDISPSRSPLSGSRTPTKIPRRLGSRPPTNTSDRATPRGSNTSRDASPVVDTSSSNTKTNSRRFSSYSSVTPETSILASSTSSVRPPSNSNDAPKMNEFGLVSKSLAASDKSIPNRRRLDSTSQIPRSRSTALAASTSSSTLSGRSSKETPADTLVITAQPSVGSRVNRRHSLISADDSKMTGTPGRAHPRTTSLSTVARPSTIATDSSAFTSSVSRKPVPRTTELSQSTSSAIATRRATSSAVSSSSSTSAAIPESRSTKSLATKLALPYRITRSSTTPSLHAEASSESSGRSSAGTSPITVTEDEVRGDEEMAAYVRRQQAKKMASGMSADAIRKLFEFPDPIEPVPALGHKDAFSMYWRYLSPYEREEIQEYDEVYFVGPNCEKHQATKEKTSCNFGFDDERGDYLLVNHDHIRFRFEVIDVLGKGSFGQVLQCRDHKTGEMVAIKIIRNKKRFHHQALVEIKVLENLVSWDPDEKHFVIRMVDSFTFRGHLCIVTELLSINLYELVKANSFNGFSTTLIRRFTIQILGSLSLLRHHRVVHCDLKPENILLKHPGKSGIKVIDFGSSCFEHEKVYTYIQSRFYRSPEVILGMNYHMAIDMWSLGCIIAEMYTGYPIFPGENEQEQLACIMEVLGIPDKYLIDRSSRKRLFFDSTGAPRPVVNSKGRRRRPSTKALAQVLKTDDELFLDFISKCLAWDPDRRLKPDPALRHPWILAGRTRTSSPNVPVPRSSRSSSAAVGSSSGSATVSSSSISTPRKKLATGPSSIGISNTVPAPRQRTQSTATANSASTARLSSKGSLQLPPSRGYSTVRASLA